VFKICLYINVDVSTLIEVNWY